MTLQGIKPGDIVRVDKRGRRFLAEVTNKESGRLTLTPLHSNITYTQASAREVIDHWRKSRKRNGKETPEAHESSNN